MRPRSSIAAGVVALVALAAPTSAAAQDTWRRPNRAMRHIHRRVGSLEWHLVSVDLTAPGVRVVGTPESLLAPRTPGGAPTWRTTSDFARHVGAEVAINANYYDIFHGAFTTCGLTMSQGRVWRSAYVDRRLDCWASVGFGARGRVALFDSRGKVYGPVPERWMREVVTGSPRVLANGEVLTYTAPRHALVPNPRTLVGVSADRHTLYLMVVNGREGANKGMTCMDAARVLRDFGASDAINLDGGGSSSLYIRSQGGLVTRPADRLERPVANHLGIVFDAAPEPDEAPEAPARPTALQAAVALPTTTPRAPARGPSAAHGRPPVVRAGCQAAPGPVTPETAWTALVLAVLLAVVRRSPREPE
jgi:MYXO-CTERM domain-containing protein